MEQGRRCLSGGPTCAVLDMALLAWPPARLQVTALYSEEGEKVLLKTSFNPAQAGGNVEKWLIECEAAMRDTIRDITRRSFDAHVTTKRIDWVLQWPGQVRADCVLLAAQAGLMLVMLCW